MRHGLHGLSIVFLLGLITPALGQILIIDRRPHVPIARSYEIREVTLDGRVRDQVAEVQVSQTFHNPGSTQIDAEFVFPLPEDGAVQNFVLMVDGKELPGRIVEKDEARRIYEDIVRRKRDPALLEYMGRGMFRTSVFPIPPGADRKVTMRYTQILKRDRNVVELTYPFGTDKFTAKPIERLEMTVRLESETPIKSLYSPGHEVDIDRDGDHRATVKLVRRDIIPTADFRLIYTLAEGDVAATVLSTWPDSDEDGYFLLLASPKVRKPDERPRPKTVVFVLDRSGSMSGKKIEQARQSLKFVLDNLREDDLFNIIAYDDRVESFKPELQRYSRENRSEAARFVENIRPGGSTDIDAALRTALEMLQDDERPNYVLFLTDGLPTAGETKETVIAKHVEKANQSHARLFVFGVGNDVNARLLDRLSGDNGGTSEYVLPDENIERKVGRFFTKMTSPVLSRIEIRLSDADVNRTYPRDIPDLFEGGQLVWVGRYRDSGRATVRISGKVGTERQTFESSTELARSGRGSAYDFVARLWAVRRIGFLIDQIDLHGKSRELTDELVDLSKKFGILTPYTSFLADENVPISSTRELERRASESLGQIQMETGAWGVAQRAAKQDYMWADQAQDAAVAYAPSGGSGGVGGMGMSRMGGGGGAAPAPDMSGTSASEPVSMIFGAVVARDADGGERVVSTVRRLGGKTFYLRGKVWMDAEVKPEEEARAQIIEQFSDAYFQLAEAQGTEGSQYFTFNEPVVIKLQGQVYRINPPQP